MDARANKRLNVVDLVKRNSAITAGLGIAATSLACSITLNEFLTKACIAGWTILAIGLGGMALRGWKNFKKTDDYKNWKSSRDQQKQDQKNKDEVKWLGTQSTIDRLKALGYNASQINKMKPEDVNNILYKGRDR